MKTRDDREIITVFTDASFDHETKAAGYAIWIKGPSEIRYGEAGVLDGSIDNSSVVEFAAVRETN
jgi:hypothetical protein